MHNFQLESIQIFAYQIAKKKKKNVSKKIFYFIIINSTSFFFGDMSKFKFNITNLQIRQINKKFNLLVNLIYFIYENNPQLVMNEMRRTSASILLILI